MDEPIATETGRGGRSLRCEGQSPMMCPIVIGMYSEEVSEMRLSHHPRCDIRCHSTLWLDRHVMRRIITSIVLLALGSPASTQAQTPGAVINDLMSRNLNLMPEVGHIVEMIAQSTLPYQTSEHMFATTGSNSPNSTRMRQFWLDARSLGRHHRVFSIDYNHFGVASLAGQSKDNLFTTAVVAPTVVNANTTSLSVSVNEVVLNFAYGITANTDVAVSVPIGHTSASGTVTSQFICSTPTRPFCPEGTTAPRQISEAASGSGFGDVALHVKAAVFSSPILDLEAIASLHLPTGDPDKLLGVGKTQGQLSLVVSKSATNISPRASFGYLVGGTGPNCSTQNRVNCIQSGPPEPSPELDYSVGVSASLAHVTYLADVIGRSLRQAASVSFQSFDIAGSTERIFPVEKAVVNLTYLSSGVRIDIGDSAITVAVLLPLNDHVIRINVSPFVGFSRRF
jgi:hypothetical protein